MENMTFSYCSPAVDKVDKIYLAIMDNPVDIHRVVLCPMTLDQFLALASQRANNRWN